MMLAERKVLILKTIRKLEDRLVSLAHCEYDGSKSYEERNLEIEMLQGHLHCAHSVLVIINEEEIEAA